MLALVTGASAGFGYSISKKLIELGYNVIGCGRRAGKLKVEHAYHQRDNAHLIKKFTVKGKLFI